MKKILGILLTILIVTTQTTLSKENDGFFIKGNISEIKSKYKEIKKPKISIKVEELELESYLKEHYLAYKYTIKNESKENLFILSGNFQNGINGGDAYLKIRENADSHLREAVWKHSSWGWWTLGIAWAYDLLRSPFIWHHHIKQNKEMKIESLAYCKDKFFQSDFDPNDFIEKNILFPIDVDPYVRITFRENKTGYMFTVIKEGFDKPEKPKAEDI